MPIFTSSAAGRHNIDVMIVVNNNSSLNQESKLNDAAYGGKQRGRSTEMWKFPAIDFTKIAEDLVVPESGCGIRASCVLRSRRQLG